jgi:hypothetical protein
LPICVSLPRLWLDQPEQLEYIAVHKKINAFFALQHCRFTVSQWRLPKVV